MIQCDQQGHIEFFPIKDLDSLLSFEFEQFNTVYEPICDQSESTTSAASNLKGRSVSSIFQLDQTKFRVREKFSYIHSSGSHVSEESSLVEKASSFSRVLICHDMMGGYQEDRYIGGTGSSSGYRFHHWHLVDIFIYFSHHMVSLPPPDWISLAHSHHVLCLGTFITEWEAGATACERAFESEHSIRLLSKKLAQIAARFRFDGWFINIENLVKVEQLPNFTQFLRLLKSEMKQEGVPVPTVLVYDSIVNSGKLDWQNCLNEMNLLFFEACDGIFTNYTWKEEHLVRSVTHAKASASNPNQHRGRPDPESIAGSVELQGRVRDVFVGIDIFGRGCPGKFSTFQSAEKIIQHSLSLAIFANGWTFEKFSREQFHNINDLFWRILQCFLSVRPTFVGLPFRTNFNDTVGCFRFSAALLTKRENRYSLTEQDAMPTFGIEQFLNCTQPECAIHHSKGKSEIPLFSHGQDLFSSSKVPRSLSRSFCPALRSLITMCIESAQDASKADTPKEEQSDAASSAASLSNNGSSLSTLASKAILHLLELGKHIARQSPPGVRSVLRALRPAIAHLEQFAKSTSQDNEARERFSNELAAFLIRTALFEQRVDLCDSNAARVSEPGASSLSLLSSLNLPASNIAGQPGAMEEACTGIPALSPSPIRQYMSLCKRAAFNSNASLLLGGTFLGVDDFLKFELFYTYVPLRLDALKPFTIRYTFAQISETPIEICIELIARPFNNKIDYFLDGKDLNSLSNTINSASDHFDKLRSYFLVGSRLPGTLLQTASSPGDVVSSHSKESMEESPSKGRNILIDPESCSLDLPAEQAEAFELSWCSREYQASKVFPRGHSSLIDLGTGGNDQVLLFVNLYCWPKRQMLPTAPSNCLHSRLPTSDQKPARLPGTGLCRTTASSDSDVALSYRPTIPSLHDPIIPTFIPFQIFLGELGFY